MFKTLSAIAFMFCLALPASAQTNRLHVYIWSEYIDPAIVKQFEKEFDCAVTVDVYEDNETMLAKLKDGGDSVYDIVVPSDFAMPELIGLSLLAPLRHENIPNLANVDSMFAGPPFDPGNQFSAPYQWGTVGIYMRRDGDKPIDRTWGLVFDKNRQPGPFVLINSKRELVGAALKYAGGNLNATDTKSIIAARKLLLEAKSRSLGLVGGADGKGKVLAKTATAAITYNGDAVRGMEQDPQTIYFVPREGGELWLDSMAIPAKAPNRDLAEKFINFILDEKIGAQLSNFNKYATPNRASRPLINKADLENAAIYPPPGIMAKLEFIKDVGEYSKLYEQIWLEVEKP